MFDTYKIITSIIIGTIEGITEFFPISSTGHMIIACHWLKIENSNATILEIFIQFGSMLAILCFFYKKIITILKFKKNKKKTRNMHIFFTILPTIFLGFIFYKPIKLLFNSNNVMYASILGGLFLILSEIFKPKKYTISNIHDINVFQSLIIGLFQTFCLYPGFSRSGATIAAGILLGLKRSVAIEFSFIISIPLLLGASVLDLIHNIKNISILDFPILCIGLMISFIISHFCIKKLLKIINNTSLIFFGLYRFIIAGLIYFIN